MANKLSFTIEDLLQFFIVNNGSVIYTNIVTHFKSALSDPQTRDIARTVFKDHVNTLATVSTINGTKYLLLRDKFKKHLRPQSSPEISTASTVPKHPSPVSTSENAVDCNDPKEMTTVSKQPAVEGNGPVRKVQPDARSSPPHTSSSIAPSQHHHQQHKQPQQNPQQPHYRQQNPPSHPQQQKQHRHPSQPQYHQPKQTSPPQSQIVSPLVNSQANHQSHVHSSVIANSIPTMANHSNHHKNNHINISSSNNGEHQQLHQQQQQHQLNQQLNNQHQQHKLQQTQHQHRQRQEDERRGSAVDSELMPPPPARPLRHKASVAAESKHANSQVIGDAEKNNHAGNNKENLTPEPPNDNEVKKEIQELAMTAGRVKEHAQILNKLVTSNGDYKLPMPSAVTSVVNKIRSGQPPGTDSDSGQYSLISEKHKRWIVAAATCDYQVLVSMLKEDETLAGYCDFMNGFSALHWASKFGRMDIVKLIAGKYQADPNKRSFSGQTPLHLAAIHNHPEIWELLVEVYLANVNVRDYDGKKPKSYLKRSDSDKKNEAKSETEDNGSTNSTPKEDSELPKDPAKMNLRNKITYQSILVRNKFRKSGKKERRKSVAKS